MITSPPRKGGSSSAGYRQQPKLAAASGLDGDGWVLRTHGILKEMTWAGKLFDKQQWRSRAYSLLRSTAGDIFACPRLLHSVTLCIHLYSFIVDRPTKRLLYTVKISRQASRLHTTHRRNWTCHRKKKVQARPLVSSRGIQHVISVGKSMHPRCKAPTDIWQEEKAGMVNPTVTVL